MYDLLYGSSLKGPLLAVTTSQKKHVNRSKLDEISTLRDPFTLYHCSRTPQVHLGDLYTESGQGLQGSFSAVS